MNKTIYKLGELVEITSSKRIYMKDYVANGIPFFRSKEIIELFNHSNINDVLYIREEKYEVIKNQFGVPVKDDLLLTSVGTVGIPYLVKNKDKFYFKDGNLTWFRNFSRNIKPKYLFYYFQSPLEKKRIINYSKGSSQSALTIETLKEIKIELPPINFQEIIIKTLSTYDDLIDINQKRIQLLEEAARLLYREWFVYFRFPGHENVKIVDGIPEGWEKFHFTDLVDFKEGPGLRNYQFREKGIPFLNIRTFGNDEIDLNKVGYLDENEVYSKYKHFLLKEDDHIISSSGTLGRLVTIRKTHLPLMLNTSLIRMRPKSPMKKWTLKAYLLYGDFIKKVTSMATGAAQLNFGPLHLRKTTIFFPKNYKIIDRFEENVSTIYLTKKNLLEQNKKLSQARDLLLPRLMSGKINVSEFDNNSISVESEVEKIVK